MLHALKKQNKSKINGGEKMLPKIRIMFVCHGNICRSPMAEFIMKDLVKKQGIEYKFEIASSATSTEEIWNGIGNPVYPPARGRACKAWA